MSKEVVILTKINIHEIKTIPKFKNYFTFN